MIGGDEKNSPSHVQVFINRDDIDFSNVGDLKKTMAQEFDLGYDARGDHEHQTKLTKFANCNSVTLVRLAASCRPLIACSVLRQESRSASHSHLLDWI